MNIPQVILGVVMVCVGIYIVILQIKWFKKGSKDQFGYQGRFLLGGFGIIVIGILIIVKSL
jgi:xanthine/uracil permease